MGNLTQNFSGWEFICPCCGHRDVVPLVSMVLVEALQLLRDKIARPIRVTSGYRCLRYNRQIRSKDTSQHILGQAADILVDGMTPGDLARYAVCVREFQEGGIGVYVWGCHLDIRNIGRPVRWGVRWRGVK